MIVIADTTTLNYLILIDLTRILAELFGQVVIPQAVLNELQSPQAPEEVREWFAHCPDWLVVREVPQPDPTLAHLDPGEREAITLAQELQADLIRSSVRKASDPLHDRHRWLYSVCHHMVKPRAVCEGNLIL